MFLKILKKGIVLSVLAITSSLVRDSFPNGDNYE